MEYFVKIRHTLIEGLFVVSSTSMIDQRGQFSRLFCANELLSVLGERRIVQINHSITYKVGTVRGMHFQYKPFSEMKFVRCVKGRIWDVAIDLRSNSKTFLKWHAEELSQNSGEMMLIPEGCAHGFQVLESDSELLYLHTAYFEKSSEGGVRFDDPLIRIHWPLPITDLSIRDQNHQFLEKNFSGIEI